MKGVSARLASVPTATPVRLMERKKKIWYAATVTPMIQMIG